MTRNHPDRETLLFLASGRSEPATVEHLEGCSACRQRVAELRSVLSAAREELLEQRPCCPSPDELAAWDVQAPHPHLETCSLCREEVGLREILDRDGSSGGDSAATAAPWMAPFESVAGAAAYLDVGMGERLVLVAGQVLQSRVGEATVSLECTGDLLRIRLEGGPVVLVLGDEFLEKRLPLAPGEQRMDVGSWRWAKIEAQD